MYRAAVFALFASSVLAAGAAQAQQVCCVPAQPPRPDGMRGYAQPQYPPQYPAPQYAQPQYGQPQYAPPQYPERPPASGLRGYVGVEYGKTRLGPGSPATRVESWTGEGAVVGQVGGFGVQGDVKVANFDTVGAGSDTTWSPTLHLYKRSPYGLIGGWAGWSHTDGSNLYGLGIEGQAYMSGATIYGSVGYGHAGGATDANLWSARLEGRYFVTENFALNLQGGLVRTSVNGGRTTVRTIGVGAEYQPGSLPFSVLAGYSHADASNSSVEGDTVRIGLRWNFDGGALVERDRLGPSLSNVTDQFQTN